MMVDEDAPAGIVGAEFFGGNKEKEEFYDPVAEAEAQAVIETVYDRFGSREAFCSDQVAYVARDVQRLLNQALGKEVSEAESYRYADNLQWQSPFSLSSSSTPLQALTEAAAFYNDVHVAIVAGQVVDDDTTVDLSWEMSVEWPTLWAPRAIVTGTSRLTLRGADIVAQVDRLSQDNLVAELAAQLAPRFWDVYHIGMTPATEQAPRLQEKKRLLADYQHYRLPARWYLEPSMLDSGSREDANADMIPNHAFSSVIKTMGPLKQRYTPASPTEVQLVPEDGSLRLSWRIPLTVECAAEEQWPVPGEDEEADEGSMPECEYRWRAARRVATMAYGGGPQDAEITEVRKRLYEQVAKDGLRPKLDENGRPIFFFWQNAVKACYTAEGGLGMAVYEWRPRFTKPNEVGIELEL